jgi:hypothetical protein
MRRAFLASATPGVGDTAHAHTHKRDAHERQHTYHNINHVIIFYPSATLDSCSWWSSCVLPLPLFSLFSDTRAPHAAAAREVIS